jgi:hypothetical protein
LGEQCAPEKANGEEPKKRPVDALQLSLGIDQECAAKDGFVTDRAGSCQ